MNLSEAIERLADIVPVDQTKMYTGTYPDGCDMSRNLHVFDLRIDEKPLRFVCNGTLAGNGIEESKFGHQIKLVWDFSTHQNLTNLTDVFRVSEYFSLDDTFTIRPVTTGPNYFLKLKTVKDQDRYQFNNNFKAIPSNFQNTQLKSGDSLKVTMIPKVYVSQENDKHFAGFFFYVVDITKAKTPASKKKK